MLQHMQGAQYSLLDGCRLTPHFNPFYPVVLPPMGYAYYRNINDSDMRALIKYLRSLPAKTTPSP